LEAIVSKHGGKLEFFGHPTTTLEDLFLRIVEESKAHPGRRYLPATGDKPNDDLDRDGDEKPRNNRK